MDRERVKNFIIVLLVMVNLFFLAIVVSDRAQTNAVERQARQALISVFSDAGIELDPALDLSARTGAQIRLTQDLDIQADCAAALVGRDAVCSELGGNSYYYAGSDGSVRFLGTGSFEYLPRFSSVSVGKDPVDSAGSRLEAIGLDWHRDSALLEATNTGYEATLTCCWEKQPIFNCQVHFTFSSSCLQLVSGQRPLDTEESRDETGVLDLPTILLRFLELLREQGHVCSEIRTLEPGYWMDSPVSGSVVLTPVWHIVTDVDEYYISGLTGKSVWQPA